MNKAEWHEYIKDFFERYYEKMCGIDPILVTLPDIPKQMWAGTDDPSEEWQRWKLVPSTVTEEDLDQLEKKVGVKFPTFFRVFLSTYFHYFRDFLGENSCEKDFDGVHNAWNPMLVKAGYLPFTWDAEGYYIYCIDLKAMPEEDKCGVYQIDHEVMFDFDEETVTTEEIDEVMEKIADNFKEYLEWVMKYERDEEDLD